MRYQEPSISYTSSLSLVKDLVCIILFIRDIFNLKEFLKAFSILQKLTKITLTKSFTKQCKNEILV